MFIDEVCDSFYLCCLGFFYKLHLWNLWNFMELELVRPVATGEGLEIGKAFKFCRVFPMSLHSHKVRVGDTEEVGADDSSSFLDDVRKHLVLVGLRGGLDAVVCEYLLEVLRNIDHEVIVFVSVFPPVHE